MRLARLILPALLVLVLAALPPAPASAASFTVNSTGDAVDDNIGDGLCATATNVCTLRAAIQEANALAGSHNISFSAALTGQIVQLNSPLPTIVRNITIDAASAPGLIVQGDTGIGGLHQIFLISSGVTVNMFAFTARYGVAIGLTTDDGGIIDNEGGIVNLSNMIISTGSAYRGGGIYSNGGVIDLNSSLVLQSAAAYGGGIYLENGAELSLNNGSSIVQNIAQQSDSACAGWGKGSLGGGLYASESDVTITDGVIQENEAEVLESCGSIGASLKGYGGGMYVLTSTVTLDNSQVLTNTANIGGGSYAENSSLFVQNNSLVAGNDIDFLDGGGINHHSGYLVVEDSVVRDNNTDSLWAMSGGGGVYVGPDALADIVGSEISDNRARFGGGVWVSGRMYMTDSFVTANVTHSINACGGGIFNSFFSLSNVHRSTVSNNDAFGTSGFGGGICNEGRLYVYASNIFGNEALNSGGGIYNGFLTQLQIENSAIFNNHADLADTDFGQGGGVFSTGDAFLHDNRIYDNSAAYSGGGVHNQGGTIRVYSSTLDGNTANYGGGFYQHAGTAGEPAKIANSTISGNTANFGGGVGSENGEITIINSTIYNNIGTGGTPGIYDFFDTSVITVSNSIVATSFGGVQCNGININGVGPNISSDASCSGFTMPNTDPLLGPLALNGISEYTHAPAGNSPALKAGDLTICNNDPINNLDQRSIHRTDDDGLCDLGAHERFTTLACSDPNLTIPENDPNGVSDTITLGGAGIVQDVDVHLTVTHPYVGDVTADLSHTLQAAIIDRPGHPDIFGGCNGHNIIAVLDDEAADPIEDECTGAIPSIGGRFTPNDPLATFNNLSPVGDWTLTVNDLFADSSNGTLDAWCVDVASYACYQGGALSDVDAFLDTSGPPRIRLEWPAAPLTTNHLVFRDPSDPYFTPNYGIPYGMAEASPYLDPDTGVLALPENMYYGVAPRNSCSLTTITPATRVGVFHYAIEPGS